jgi:hypothetical protein
MRLVELQQAVRAADAAAVLVSPRVLERLIQGQNQLSNFFGQTPHRKCYVVDRPTLYRYVEQDELELEPAGGAVNDLAATPTKREPNTGATKERRPANPSGDGRASKITVDGSSRSGTVAEPIVFQGGSSGVRPTLALEPQAACGSCRHCLD